MGSVTDIRTGIAENISAANSALEVYVRVPGQIVTPCAIVGLPEEIEFDASLARGSDRYQIPVRVYVQKADLDTAQEAVDELLDSKLATGLKTAIESDRTLGGAASTVRVTNARNYGEYQIGNVDYLGAEVIVEVYTQ